MNFKLFVQVTRLTSLAAIAVSLISCVGNNSTSTGVAANTISSNSSFSATKSAADVSSLALTPDPQYADISMKNVPISSFGLVGYKLTNNSSESIGSFQFLNQASLPKDIQVDYTRSNCYIDENSSKCSLKSLSPSQSCTIVLKFEPTSQESGNFSFSMTATTQVQQQLLTATSDQIEYYTRSQPTPPAPITGEYAYISGESTMYCSVYNDGSLANCNQLVNFDSKNISVYKGHGYIITNQNINQWQAIGTLQLCNLDIGRGSFYDCHKVDLPGIPDGSNIMDIKFYNNKAYVVDTNNVSLCSVNPADGSLANCKTTVANLNTVLYTITFNNQKAYLSGGFAAGITYCSISPDDGSLTNCQVTGGDDVRGQEEISFFQGNAYVTSPSALAKLSLNPTDGSLSNPQTYGQIAGIGWSNRVWDIKFNSCFAYMVASYDNSIFKCQVTDSGFSNCQSIVNNLNKPQYINFFQVLNFN